MTYNIEENSVDEYTRFDIKDGKEVIAWFLQAPGCIPIVKVYSECSLDKAQLFKLFKKKFGDGEFWIVGEMYGSEANNLALSNNKATEKADL